MKEIYCKYCGKELEKDSCICGLSLLNRRKAKENSKITKLLEVPIKNKKKIKCDTCNQIIDKDAVFCPYCGIPEYIDGNIQDLKKELRGEFALDVLTKKDNNASLKIIIIILILAIILVLILKLVISIL